VLGQQSGHTAAAAVAGDVAANATAAPALAGSAEALDPPLLLWPPVNLTYSSPAMML
jgi:hypothetical protein